MMELLIAAVVLWALCGIPAALIAHRKGRSVTLWAFLGSVFGIFGLATAASLPFHTEGGPWDAGSSGSFWDFGGSGGGFGFGDFGGSGCSDGGGGGGDCGGGGGG